MLPSLSRAQLAGGWFAAVIVMFAGSVVAWGAPMRVSTGLLWVFACLAPPAVMLLVWRPPTITVAEVLYAATQPTKDGRA
jgi:hypothetical protein